jgi:hypothetical protein
VSRVLSLPWGLPKMEHTDKATNEAEIKESGVNYDWYGR